MVGQASHMCQSCLSSCGSEGSYVRSLVASVACWGNAARRRVRVVLDRSVFWGWAFVRASLGSGRVVGRAVRAGSTVGQACFWSRGLLRPSASSTFVRVRWPGRRLCWSRLRCQGHGNPAVKIRKSGAHVGLLVLGSRPGLTPPPSKFHWLRGMSAARCPNGSPP
jgi:hypothetical protein